MPTVLRWRGHRFYFYSSDRDEPPHIHVDHSGRTLKVWLVTLKLAYNDGFSLREVTAIMAAIDQNRARLLEAWRDYFDG